VEVRITLPPRQNEVGPLADTPGTAGIGFTVTFTVLREFEHPSAFAVIVYCTTAGPPEELVKVWEIKGPEPGLKPVAVPDRSTGVQVNVVPTILLKSVIFVFPPEQIV
jgi:hypothetical protein